MKKVKLLVFLVLSLCFSVFVAFAEEANAADMHRLYNPNSGEHFYTANGNEKNHLVKVGWKYEGIGWTAPATGNAVYRLYNANAGDHHYTQNVNEKNHLVKVGWKYEGIGWYSDVKKTIPLYRAYNPNAKAGSHNYTVNYAEQKNLIRVGWRDEGIAWYGIRKSTPVTKYTVTVKHVGSDGKTLKTSTASVEKGKSYTAKASIFSGYTLKGSSSQTVTVNGNKTITFNYTKNATPVTKYTVIVKHVGSDGKELKKTTAAIEKGKNYTAKAETFSGYTLKGSNSQTVTVNGNKTITFNYTKNAVSTPKYTVTVVHKDIKGKELAGATKATVEEGESYTAKAVKVNGYTVTGADSKTVKIYGNTILTFTYLKNDSDYYTITVKFVDETGQNIRPASKQLVEKGDSYVANAKEIPDYTVKGNNTQTISSVSKDETLTFIYTKNTAPVTKYTITVKYVDEAGSSIKIATTANVEKGNSYKIDAPAITGYTVVAADKIKSIASVSKNETLTIKYTKNKYTITIKYLDGNGASIKASTTQTVEYGKAFSMNAPGITGYTVVPADKTKSIASVSKNETVTFNYTKNKYTITIKYLDGNGASIKASTTQTVEYGKAFSMNAPGITGYTVVPADKTKTITSVSKNETVTFKYTKNPVIPTKYTITINYELTDGTSLGSDSFQVEKGTVYEAKAKAITGYTANEPTSQKITVNGNQTVTFKYTKNKVTMHVVTIQYLDIDGNDIIPPKSVNIEKGASYTAKAEKINGYRLQGEESCTIKVEGDTIVPFKYDNLSFDRITLHAVFEGEIVKSVSFDIKPGEKFTPSSDKLKLDPDVYDLTYTTTWPEITGVGGKTTAYRFTIKPFKNYLSESELVIMQQTIIQKVNDLRKSLGLDVLQENPKLKAAATVRAKELKTLFAHTRPDGTSYQTALREQGLTCQAGENIAMVGNPNSLTSGKAAGEAMFELWKNSPGHYANMIGSKYKYIGMNVYCYGSKVYGTQLFTNEIY